MFNTAEEEIICQDIYNVANIVEIRNTLQIKNGYNYIIKQYYICL